MKLPAPTNSDFEVVPSGTYGAVCSRVIDLGTQETHYQGRSISQRKVYIEWELDERDSEGNAFIAGNRYTLSSSEKSTLRKHLESWRGKRFDDSDFGDHPGAFDICNVLSKPCLITVMQTQRDGRTYADVTAVSPLPKTMTPPELSHPPVYFSLASFDRTVFNGLSDKLRGTIEKSPEFAAAIQRQPAGTRDDDAAF